MVSERLMQSISEELKKKDYTIVRSLGENAANGSSVFLAEHGDEQRVLKLISSFSLGDGENTLEKRLEQSRREIGILRELDHPRIPKILDVFQMRCLDAIDFDVMAMQYVEMQNLKQRMSAGGILDEDGARVLLKDILGALVNVHTNGIHHRDIKPSNILFDGKAAYLIDFNFSCRGDGGSTIIDTYGYYPIDAYNGNACGSQDLFALMNVVVAGMFGQEIEEVRRLQKRNDISLPLNLDGLRCSEKFKLFLQKLGSPSAALRYQTAMEALVDLEKIESCSVDELTERLTRVTRDRRLGALIGDLRKSDELFEYNVPAKVLTDHTDAELLNFLRGAYSVVQFRILDPDYIQKFARFGDDVVARCDITVAKGRWVKNGDMGRVKILDSHVARVMFGDEEFGIPTEDLVFCGVFRTFGRDLMIEPRGYSDFFLGKIQEDLRLKKCPIVSDLLVKYVGHKLVGNFKYVIPKGAYGVVLRNFEGLNLVWRNIKEQEPLQEYICPNGEKRYQIPSDIYPFDCGVVLLRPNTIKFDELYARHFGS